MKNIRTFLVLHLCVFILTALCASAGTFTIPDWIIKSCVFVMKGDEAHGTGFIILVKDFGIPFAYLITAKHVAEGAIPSPGSLRIRINRKDKDVADIVEFPVYNWNGKPWIEHKNKAIDIAIFPLLGSFKSELYDVQPHSVNSPTNEFFACRSFIEKHKVGPGDQVFTMGLVPYLFSKDGINVMMTRSGTISMLANKELPLPGGKQKAYFLNCPAFGGQSGGPAFVLLERNESGGVLFGWRFALLGIVTEFVPSPLRQIEVTLAEREKHNVLMPIENTGISKVVPVDYLTEILFTEEMKVLRRDTANNIKIYERSKK